MSARIAVAHVICEPSGSERADHQNGNSDSEFKPPK